MPYGQRMTDDTQLNGTIPTELGQLFRLNYCFLGVNQFSGTIPTELGRLSNLVDLDLSKAKFVA
jgi:hypothetical protein